MSREDDFDDFITIEGDVQGNGNASASSFEEDESIDQPLTPAVAEPEPDIVPMPRRSPAKKKKKAVPKVQPRKKAAKPARKPAPKKTAKKKTAKKKTAMKKKTPAARKKKKAGRR